MSDGIFRLLLVFQTAFCLFGFAAACGFRLLEYFGGAGSLKSNKHHHSRAGGNLVWGLAVVCLFGRCRRRAKIPAQSHYCPE